MELADFYDRVKEDGRFSGTGIVIVDEDDVTKDILLVQDNATPTPRVQVQIPADVILEESWANLRNAMDGTIALYHVARIVGYFSRIENWNQSKIGELAARHRGDYKIKDEAEKG